MSTREGNLEPPRAIHSTGKFRISTTKTRSTTSCTVSIDICHGCRRCFNLCTAFPTLFDLVDESPV